MMKRMIAILLALVLMAGIAGTALAASSATITASSLNVRAGVGTGYKVRKALSRNTEVYYLGVSDVDNSGDVWYKVQYGAYDTGWVSAKYTSLNTNTQVVTSYCKAEYGDTYVRSNPNLDGSKVSMMPKGSTAVYLNQMMADSRGVDWYYVNYNGAHGWVSSKYTYLFTESTSGAGLIPNLPNQGSTKGTLKAEGGDAYIRAAASLNGSELGVLKKGSSATYLNERSVDSRGVVWFKVNYNGTTGWVSSKYGMLYGNNSSSSGGNSGGSTSNKSYVKASSGKTNVRNQPNLNGKSLKVMEKGTTATYLNASSTDERGVVWYKVSYNGTTGWVSSKYTSLTNKKGSSSSSSGSSSTGFMEGNYIRSTAKSNIRNKPNLNGKVVDTMQKNDTATFTGATSTDERGVVWYSIRFGGANGWVSSKYTVIE